MAVALYGMIYVRKDKLQFQSVEPYLKEKTWPYFRNLAKEYTFICFKLK